MKFDVSFGNALAMIIKHPSVEAHRNFPGYLMPRYLVQDDPKAVDRNVVKKLRSRLMRRVFTESGHFLVGTLVKHFVRRAMRDCASDKPDGSYKQYTFEI